MSSTPYGRPSSRRQSLGNGNGTPSSSLSSSASNSRFSTPITHNAIRRLQGGKGSERRSSSLLNPQQDTDSEHAAATPPPPLSRASKRHPSSQGSGDDPFTSSSANNGPRTPVQGTPSRRRGGVRIIKSPSSSKSWYRRLLQLPKDIYDRYELQLNEALLTDLEQLDDYAYSLGIVILGLHLLLRITISASSTFSSSSDASSTSPFGTRNKVAKYASSAEARLAELRQQAQSRLLTWAGLRNFIARCTTLLCWSLVLLSLLNAYWLFSHRRKYRLFLREDPVNSPNARRVQMDSPGPVSRESDEEEEQDGQQGTSKKRAALWKRLFWKGWEALRGSTKPITRQEVQELSVWTPPTFGLRFFAVYSPPIALLIQFINRNNFLVFAVAGALLSLQTFTLVRYFTQLLQDRQTINREVMSEYNSKFVAPRIHYARKDASTMTNEAEMFDYRAYTKTSTIRGRHSIGAPSTPYY